MRAILIFVLTLVLGGCTRLPYKAESFLEDLPENLSINTRDVKYYSRCDYGVTAPNSRVAQFQDCVYIQTSQEIIILGWNKVARIYQKDMVIPFDRIGRFSLCSFGLARQLQLFTDVSQIAIGIHSSSLTRSFDDYDLVVSILTKAGVTAVESPGMVRMMTDTVVPIFIK